MKVALMYLLNDEGGAGRGAILDSSCLVVRKVYGKVTSQYVLDVFGIPPFTLRLEPGSHGDIGNGLSTN
ncbi:hypothetical protein [Luteibacter sp. E-22]|uniref:hypothetical protein n=1 Tax=Luteibacter sp. E-22 TaxID=3404050 RepID=UPI003CF175B0